MAYNISYTIIAVDNFSAVVAHIEKQVQSVAKKIDSFNSRMATTGKKIAKIGKGFSIGISAPLAALGGVALHTSVTFEKAMNMVHADTNATAKQFKMLEDAALHFGATTAFSARDVANAEMFLGRSGKKTHEILMMLPHVLNLAAASQLDMGQAADISVKAMSAYNIQAKDMQNMNDVLAKAFTSSNVNLEMLGESLKYAGTVAKGAGLSFKDTVSILGIMGNAGMQATMAGTGLKSIISNSLTPNKQLTKAMKEIGITFVNSKTHALELLPAIRKLSDAGLTAAGSLQFFKLRGGPAMEALVNHVPGLNKLNASLDHTSGITDRLRHEQMEGLVGSTKRLTSAFEGMQIRTTEAVKGPLMSLMDTITDATNKFNLSSDGIKKWTAYAVGMGISLGPVMVGVGKFLILMSFVATKVPIAATAMRGLAIASSFLWAVFWPVAIVAGALAGLYYLYTHFESVKKVVNKFSDVLYATFLTIDKVAVKIYKIGKIIVESMVWPIKEAIKAIIFLGEKFEWIFSKIKERGTVHFKQSFGAPKQPASRTEVPTGIYQHNVKSSLDISVYDPTKVIKKMVGKTTGAMDVDLGQNMALAR